MCTAISSTSQCFLGFRCRFLPTAPPSRRHWPLTHPAVVTPSPHPLVPQHAVTATYLIVRTTLPGSKSLYVVCRRHRRSRHQRRCLRMCAGACCSRYRDVGESSGTELKQNNPRHQNPGVALGFIGHSRLVMVDSSSQGRVPAWLPGFFPPKRRSCALDPCRLRLLFFPFSISEFRIFTSADVFWS
jgi:hypothetical protein